MSIIDSHFHWYPRSLFERLCDQRGFPRAERNGDGFSYRYDGGKSFANMPAVWLDLERGLEAAQAATGPDTAVVATAGVLSGLLDQLPLADASEIAAEYNEQMAQAQRRYPGRFYGTAYVPLGDTDEAVRLTDHAVNELGLVGVNLPAVTDQETIDTARLDGFYQRVEELGVPLIVHPTDYVYGHQFDGYDSAIFLTIGRLIDSSVTILRLIFSGVLERHSALKVIHTHAGGLLPYQAGRIDKNVYRSSEITGLPHAPSDYMKRIFVDTVAPQELTIRTALEFYGSGNVLYGTDYPCWSPAKAIQVIDDAHLGAAERESVLRRNAESVLNLAEDGARPPTMRTSNADTESSLSALAVSTPDPRSAHSSTR